MNVNRISNSFVNFKSLKNEPVKKQAPESTPHKMSDSTKILAALGAAGVVTIGVIAAVKSHKKAPLPLKPNSAILEEIKRNLAESKQKFYTALKEKYAKFCNIETEGLVAPKKLASLMENSPVNFLERSPKNYYLQNGREVNQFLRGGKLKELPESLAEVDEAFRPFIVENAEYNKAIVNSIEKIDNAVLTSITLEPKTVYRFAPATWLDTAENGILKDKGFFSTSTERGASLEQYCMENPVCFEIKMPAGMNYLDLTHTSEKEMLFGRNCIFKNLGNNVLEFIGQAADDIAAIA